MCRDVSPTHPHTHTPLFCPKLLRPSDKSSLSRSQQLAPGPHWDAAVARALYLQLQLLLRLRSRKPNYMYGGALLLHFALTLA